ncbi:MAG TPA: hypothetical protein VKZ91_08240 [Woeseiaceae bacterium]|nr:hypothetical protein [Woeseiaceae bacterium]
MCRTVEAIWKKRCRSSSHGRHTLADFDGLGISRGVFAPTIEFHDGTFYVLAGGYGGAVIGLHARTEQPGAVASASVTGSETGQAGHERDTTANARRKNSR